MTLENPGEDIKAISHDLTGTIALKRTNGKTITSLEIQEFYLEVADKNLSELTTLLVNIADASPCGTLL